MIHGEFVAWPVETLIKQTKNNQIHKFSRKQGVVVYNILNGCLSALLSFINFVLIRDCGVIGGTNTHITRT